MMAPNRRELDQDAGGPTAIPVGQGANTVSGTSRRRAASCDGLCELRAAGSENKARGEPSCRVRGAADATRGLAARVLASKGRASRVDLRRVLFAVTIAVSVSACGESGNPLSPSPDAALIAPIAAASGFAGGEGGLTEATTRALPKEGELARIEDVAPEQTLPEAPATSGGDPEPGTTVSSPAAPAPDTDPPPAAPAPNSDPPPPAPAAEPDPPPPAPAAEPDPPPPAPAAEPDPPPPAPAAEPEPPPAPPAEPDPPPEPIPPTGFNLDYEPSLASSKIRFDWNRAPEGTYQVELGSSPGATNYGTVQVSGTSFEQGGFPPGDVFARVRTVIAGVLSGPSNEVDVHYFDFKDYIEAIFLGSGPLTPRDGNHGCSYPGKFAGFSPGTVDVIISTIMGPWETSQAQNAANEASQATAGAVSANVSQTSDPLPIPGHNQITVTEHSSPMSQGCSGGAGCTIHMLNDWSRVILNVAAPPKGYYHEMGHALTGLCHIDGGLIGGPSRSIMGAGPGVWANHLPSSFTSYDMEASQAVYLAGIGVGQGRSAFVGAGLINP